MTALKVAKPKLLAALAKVVDEPLSLQGYSRGKNGLIYKRKLNDSVQEINFIADWYPRYRPGAEAFIHPVFLVSMPKINKLGLYLVNGDKFLLGGARYVAGQPIEFTVSKEKRPIYFATGEKGFVEVCGSILAFLRRTVLPLLDELSTPADLVRVYESNDPRVWKQKHWHVYIAAAYCELGTIEKAREVINEQFASLGLRRQYSMVFESLAALE